MSPVPPFQSDRVVIRPGCPHLCAATASPFGAQCGAGRAPPRSSPACPPWPHGLAPPGSRSKGAVTGQPASSPPPDPQPAWRPAALTLAHTAEVCRARQAQGSSQLHASTCGETESERTPGGAPALLPAHSLPTRCPLTRRPSPRTDADAAILDGRRAGRANAQPREGGAAGQEPIGGTRAGGGARRVVGGSGAAR